MSVKQFAGRAVSKLDEDLRYDPCDVNVKLDNCGIISVIDRSSLSDFESSSLGENDEGPGSAKLSWQPLARLGMRVPTTDELKLVKNEINSISHREGVLPAKEREEIVNLIASAKNELRIISSDVTSPKLKLVSEDRADRAELLFDINNRWEKINSILVAAEGYYDEH